MELLFVRHRVAVKLVNLGQGEAISIQYLFMKASKLKEFFVYIGK